MAADQTKVRNTFFQYLFGEDEGYVCIASSDPNKGKTSFTQSFFRWPEERVPLLAFIDKRANKYNLWYCTSLLEGKKRTKDRCLAGRLVWADLDTAKPGDIQPAPSIVVQSSPQRYQALWRLDVKVPPDIAEQYSKRIAYMYNENGVDPSGWDLTQLLRVPLTRNFKYGDEAEPAPEVLLVSADDTLISPDVFEAIELVELKKEHGEDDVFDQDMPDLDSLPNPEWAIYKVQEQLNRTAFKALYTQEPDESQDWSGILWRFILLCLESGMTLEETFSVSMTAACNKYKRDNRPPRYLWRDVVKADAHLRRLTIITGTISQLTMPELVPENAGTECWLDQYKDWGTGTTDAVPVYHELAAAIALSSVCANSLRCKSSLPNDLVPNIWGLVLGDSTLTRKSTAMRMAMDIVAEIDDEYILATDGSAEGLMSGLQLRPNQTSIYFKDEVSGFFDSINRKDYLAGMPELLTQLYDAPPIMVRRLRKETITITNPVFIFFGGGIRDKVYELVTEQYILSGFLPRFLVVSGEADLSRVKRTGPPSDTTQVKRDAIVNKLREMHATYSQLAPAVIGGKKMMLPAKFYAQLEPKAWDLFGDIEMKLMQAADTSAISMIAMPTLTRMAFSTLKLAILIAASERKPTKDLKLKVTAADLTNAARFTQGWGRFTVDLLHNAGKSITERTLDKILSTIRRNPGVTRSELMRRHHMLSRDTDLILKSLDERGQIVLKQEGRGFRIWAA